MSLVESSRPVRVEIRKVAGGYSLFRNGDAFFVRGAAGFERVRELAEAGGNSLRTWGMDQTERALPDIRRYGLSLCAGLWMVPPRQGFDYSNEAACLAQFDELQQQILKLAAEPSLLVWGVGNELELGMPTMSPNVWREVEKVAAYVKEIDPSRPVMTVLASVDEVALQCIDAYCPSIDFVSFNSYGDLELVQSKLDAVGWGRPYLVTEWGANGHWEVRQTSWGAEIEPSSTEKAAQVRQRFRSLDGTNRQCLGSYAFLWGSKQERTPTWYGFFDEKGCSTESVAALSALWLDGQEDEACPQIASLKLAGLDAFGNVSLIAGERVEAACELHRGDFIDGALAWSILRESDDKRVGGDREEASETVEIRFENLGSGKVCFSAPSETGAYRLYLLLRGPRNWIATANLPFLVQAKGE